MFYDRLLGTVLLIMKEKIENARNLLDGYYNFLMDEFNGNASEEAIDMFIQQNFKHIHVNNGKDDYCKECGYDLRSEIHSSARS